MAPWTAAEAASESVSKKQLITFLQENAEKSFLSSNKLEGRPYNIVKRITKDALVEAYGKFIGGAADDHDCHSEASWFTNRWLPDDMLSTSDDNLSEAQADTVAEEDFDADEEEGQSQGGAEEVVTSRLKALLTRVQAHGMGDADVLRCFQSINALEKELFSQSHKARKRRKERTIDLRLRTFKRCNECRACKLHMPTDCCQKYIKVQASLVRQLERALRQWGIADRSEVGL